MTQKHVFPDIFLPAFQTFPPEKENLQNVPAEVCASWYRKFSISRHIIIENLENIRETAVDIAFARIKVYLINAQIVHTESVKNIIASLLSIFPNM